MSESNYFMHVSFGIWPIISFGVQGVNEVLNFTLLDALASQQDWIAAPAVGSSIYIRLNVMARMIQTTKKNNYAQW